MTNVVTKTWLEMTIDCSGSEVFIAASSSRKEQRSRRPLGVDRDSLLRFAVAVERSAARGYPLADEVLAQARTIRQAVLAGDIGVLFGQLCEAAKGRLLVRFAVDVALQAVPWEALCNADEALGFWGTSANVFPVRSVLNKESWQPREVRGAVKVLAIAPTGSAGLANLKQALAGRIATGEVEWFDPAEGSAARVKAIMDRLRREPIPHVIHFLGHGGIDTGGRPALRLGDDADREEKWLAAEVLAQHLKAHSQGLLRLVVLEACEGAKPGAFASAAEIIAGAGADAVVAHLWPVRADVARTFSTELYRVLTEANYGDVAFAANEARRAMLGAYDSSAEALGPVVYLRAPDGAIFDFERRVLIAPQARVVVPDGAPEVPPAVDRIQGAAASLSLWKGGRAVLPTVSRLGALLILLTLIYLGRNKFFQSTQSFPVSPDTTGCSTGRSFYAGTCVDNKQVDFAVCVREVHALTASSMVDEAIKRNGAITNERMDNAIVDDIQKSLPKLPLGELQAILKFCKEFASVAGISVPMPSPPPSPPNSTPVPGVRQHCAAGFDDCDKDPAHVCETDVRRSVDHCGNCGTRCVRGANAEAICRDGKCVGVTSCMAGYADCDDDVSTGCETDLASPTTCGACNNNCSAVPNSTAVCHSGHCGFECSSDYADCNKNDIDGCETSLNSPKTCGSCTNDCTRAASDPNMMAACESRKCTFKCQPNYADCNHKAADGCETRLDSPENCGSCGVKCAKYCVTGICFDKWPFTGDPPKL